MSAVALTGGIAVGKSTVARLLSAHAIPLLDTDAVAAELTGASGAALPALRNAFGPDVLGQDGALDRQKMRERVFRDPAARRLLESILHPMIRDRTDAFLAQQGGNRCAVAIPLFFESLTYRGRFREIVVVDCPSAMQRLRLVRDRGMDAALADSIIETQARRAIRLQLADRVLVNNSDVAALQAQVESWIQGWS